MNPEKEFLPDPLDQNVDIGIDWAPKRPAASVASIVADCPAAPIMPAPRFLVLLATHNGARWINEQIDSVLRQRGVDVNILLRDDASSDETLAQVASRFGADSRLRVWADNSRRGSAAANFFALIDIADPNEYDYIAFCDQDDYWVHSKLLRAAGALIDSSAAGYSSSVKAFWPGGKSLNFLSRRKLLKPTFSLKVRGKVAPLSCQRVHLRM